MKIWIPILFLFLSACAGNRPAPLTLESNDLNSESFDNFDDEGLENDTESSQFLGSKAIIVVEQGLTNGTVNMGQAFELRAVFSVSVPDGESVVTENRWFKDGVRIPGANLSSFRVNSASSTSAGIYVLNVVEILSDGREAIIYGTSSRVNVSAPQFSDPDQSNSNVITTQSELCPNSSSCREGTYRIDGQIFLTTGLPLRLRVFLDGRFCILDEALPGEGRISAAAYNDMVNGSRRLRWDVSTYENGKCEGI